MSLTENRHIGWISLSEGRKVYSLDIDEFRAELQDLIERKRGKYPKQGDLLVLETTLNQHVDMKDITPLVNLLKKSDFNDMHNWSRLSVDKFADQIIWWRSKLGFDVVCLPGFNDENEIYTGSFGYLRVFTRPTYIREETSNLNKG